MLQFKVLQREVPQEATPLRPSLEVSIAGQTYRRCHLGLSTRTS